jgi:hypothetical protein
MRLDELIEVRRIPRRLCAQKSLRVRFAAGNRRLEPCFSSEVAHVVARIERIFLELFYNAGEAIIRAHRRAGNNSISRRANEANYCVIGF